MLCKASRILSSFTAMSGGLNLSTIAERSGLAISTTHRLVGELCDLGWLTRSGKTYSLGLALFEFGELVPIKHRLRTVALPFMQDLLAVTNETIHLGIRDGSDVVYIEKLHRHNVLGLPSRTGGRAPLTCTAVGKALLLYEAPEVLEEILSEPLPALTANSITDPVVFRSKLDAARPSFLTTDLREASGDGCCVGTPVMIGDRTVAALSVSSPASRFNPQRFGPALRTASLGLARRLGMRYRLSLEEFDI